MKDSRYYGPRSYDRIYRLFGNIGAVGSAVMANRYQVSENRVKESMGNKGWSASYFPNYKEYMAAIARGRSKNRTPSRSRSRSRSLIMPKAPRKRSVSWSTASRPRSMMSISRSRSRSRSLAPGPRAVYPSGALKSSYKPSTNVGYKGAFNKTKKIYGSKEKCLTQGVVFNRETSSVITASATAVYLGHCTNPSQFTAQVMWLAIVKKFMLLLGVQVNDTQKQLIDFAQVGNSITVVFKQSYDAVASGTATFNATATSSMNDVAKFFSDYFTEGVNVSGQPFDQVQFDCIYFQPGVNSGLPTRRMVLKNARVHIHAVSNFTIQNRTKSDPTTDEADQVDNQPLRGFSYFGYGSGTQTNTSLPQSVSEFVCQDNYGILRKVPTSAEVELQEMPSQIHFANVKKSGAQELDAGVIKNSKLIFKKTISVNSLQKQITVNPDRGHTYHKLGKFKIFGFEKMIDIEFSQNMSIAWEHNLSLGMYLIPGNEKYSNQINEKYYI